MKLIQDLQNYTFYLGWYGTCDTICEPFDLINYKQEIHAIYQFSSSGLATSSFVADAPSWLSSFSQLECGKIYYIVMKPGSNSIDIPHLSVSAYDSSDSGARVIESCDYFNGSPYDSTPTPKFCYETSCDYDAFTHAFYLGKFREKQINNYKFNFNWGCFCPPDYSREVTIFVKDNLITKIIDTNTNEIVINGEVATYYTLEDLFNYISEAKEIHNAEEISVKYDYEYNFISSGYIDYIKEAVDDEMGFSVRDFEIIYDYTPTPNDFSPTDPTPTSQVANFDSLISEYENLTSDDPNRVNLEIRGEISYIELEGGFFGIIDSFGKQYIPINLQGALSGSNNKFLKVIRGFAKKDQISIFMWGTLIYCEDWEVQEPPIGCPEDLRICDDGTYLSRDPKLDCNFPPCTFDVNKFNASHKNWDLSNISSYSFDFAWSCFCTDEYTKNVRIYVENNKLIKIIDKLTGAEVLNNEIATYFTMTELYEYVKTAYLKNPYKITISFDDNHNIISNLFIDYEPNIADEEMGFTVSNFMYNTIEPIPTVKPKILALHGGGESSVSFQNQPGMIDLVNSLSDFEFVFADAPTNNLWIQDPPYGKDYPTTDPNWASESISYIDDLISQHGEFFGILGFSQGAAFIPVYLANTSYNFNVAIMFNGYLPYTHTGLMQTINSKAPFSIPGVVFAGENDYNFKDMAEDLYAKFSYGPLVRSQTAGHHLPFASDVSFTEIVDYIISLTYSNDL